MVLTQSENSSARAAVIIQSSILQKLNQKFESNWHQISRYKFQVSQSGFAFLPNNFFFAVIDKVTWQLISTGIIDNFINKCFASKLSSKRVEGFKILRLEDLEKIFLISLVAHGVCVVVFICEIIFWVSKNLKEFFLQLIIRTLYSFV